MLLWDGYCTAEIPAWQAIPSPQLGCIAAKGSHMWHLLAFLPYNLDSPPFHVLSPALQQELDPRSSNGSPAFLRADQPCAQHAFKEDLEGELGNLDF